MAKYLITGGAGFIGSHIAEELVKQKQTVTVLDNLSTGNEKNIQPFKDKIRFVKGDITNPKEIEKAIIGADFILHLAASLSVIESMAKPEKYIKNNITGTLNLLKAALKHQVKKFVLSSTCATYGTAEKIPTPENYIGTKLSPYALTKYAAEDFCQYYAAVFGLKTVILRYFNVFGPRQDAGSSYAGVIPIFVKKMNLSSRSFSEGGPIIFGDGQQTRDFVFVKDVALANIKACQINEADGETINVGSGKETSVNDLYKKIARLLDYKNPPKYLPARAGEAQRALADNSKMKKILKIQPGDFGKELKETVGWYKNRLKIKD